MLMGARSLTGTQRSVLASILAFVCGWLLRVATHGVYLYVDPGRWFSWVSGWLCSAGFSTLLALEVQNLVVYFLVEIPVLLACGFLVPIVVGNHWFRISAIGLLGYWSQDSQAMKLLMVSLGRSEFRVVAHHLFFVVSSWVSAFAGAYFGGRWFLRRRIDRLTCPNCGYCLFGLVERRCPECGQEFEVKDGKAVARAE